MCLRVGFVAVSKSGRVFLGALRRCVVFSTHVCFSKEKEASGREDEYGVFIGCRTRLEARSRACRLCTVDWTTQEHIFTGRIPAIVFLPVNHRGVRSECTAAGRVYSWG